MINFPSEHNGNEDHDQDSDGDGIPDYLDDDDDHGDVITDDNETGHFKDIYTVKERDVNDVNSGIENPPDDDNDSDGDGISDYLDSDKYQNNGVSDENDDDVDGDGNPDDDEVKKFKDVSEEDTEDDEVEGLFGTLGGFFKRKLLSLPPQRAGVLLYLSFL